MRKMLTGTHNLVPDVFSRDHASVSWRGWSYRLKAFVQARMPALRKAMETAEEHASPIALEDLGSFGITGEVGDQLRTVLVLKTQDRAHVVVRQSDWVPGLEQNRSLGRHH